MSDAGISDLSDDPVAALAKVEDNFRLDLTDEMVRTIEGHRLDGAHCCCRGTICPRWTSHVVWSHRDVMKARFFFFFETVLVRSLF